MAYERPVQSGALFPVAIIRDLTEEPGGGVQINSTIQRLTGAGTITITAGAQSIAVSVIAGVPTLAIGGGTAVIIPAGVSPRWGSDQRGASLAQAFVFTGLSGDDLLVITTREV